MVLLMAEWHVFSTLEALGEKHIDDRDNKSLICHPSKTILIKQLVKDNESSFIYTAIGF